MMLIILFVIFSIAFLILSHEAAHFFAAKLFGMKVEEFGFGFPPRMFAWRPRNKSGVPSETEYSFNWLPFGGFVRIAGENDRMSGNQGALESLPPEEKKRIFSFQPAWKRAAVTAAGVLMNFFAGWMLLSVILMIGTPPIVLVGGVQSGSPAAAAGLVSGDVLTGFTHAQNFVDFVNAHRGEDIVVRVMREGNALELHATPKRITAEREGALGVSVGDDGVPRLGFLSALKEGFLEAVFLVQSTVIGFWQLLVNLLVHARLLEGVVGPIGIVAIAVQTAKTGFLHLLELIAFISVNLAVINLMPFPALDGGRLLFLAVEKIKGSPLSRRLEVYANGFGLAFLLVLLTLISARDIALRL